MDQAGSAGLSWAIIRALLRNFKQMPLAKSEHEGQKQEGEKSWSQHEVVWMGTLPQPCSQDKGQIKVLAHSKVRSVLFGQPVSPHTALYKIVPGFITPGTQVTLGLTSPFKFLTLFDFLLSMFRAKTDFMHYNPLVCATKEHLPQLTAPPGCIYLKYLF